MRAPTAATRLSDDGGFTPVEIPVVTMVIGLLAAMTLPSGLGRRGEG
jgi:type II secretory pathway pseudopilin PulG